LWAEPGNRGKRGVGNRQHSHRRLDRCAGAERATSLGLRCRPAYRRVRVSPHGGQSTHDYPPRAARTAPMATDSPYAGGPLRAGVALHRRASKRSGFRWRAWSRRPSRVARQAKSCVDERRRAGNPQAGACDSRAPAEP